MQSINRLIDKSKNSHGGFTVLELLVASLLLGMLMTILTMIFSQSSIAWRTGIAGVADLDDVREKVSAIRYESDNAYVWDNQMKCVRSVFTDTGDLRTDRQLGDFGGTVQGFDHSDPGDAPNDSWNKKPVGCGDGQKSSSANYVINVMSAGPDRNVDTKYDNIYSLPDDPNDW